MTAQLSREDIRDLRSDLEDWRQDYEPKDDQVQYEMFGRAIEAMDMLLAGMDSEPVAWRWNYGGTTTWRLLDTKPMPGTNPNWPRVIQPLYAAPPAPVAVPDECTSGQAFISMRSKSMQGNYMDGWNDCRSAMQAEPVTATNITGDNHEQI